MELLTGTTAAATDDGEMEFIIDCSTSSANGWVNVDDFSATSAASSSNGLKYWDGGFPVVNGESSTSAGGETSSTYWCG